MSTGTTEPFQPAFDAAKLASEKNGAYLRTPPALDRAIELVRRQREQPEGLPWRMTRDAIAGLPDPEYRPHGCAGFPDHRYQPGACSYPGHTGSPLDGPAKTLRAGVHGVPRAENMMRRADGSVRYFTIRESARLQAFPDDLVLHGSWTEAMRQLGNAVPVDLAKAVARSVKRQLDYALARDGHA